MIPTSTNISIDTRANVPDSADAIVVFATEGATQVESAAQVPGLERAVTSRLFKLGIAKGKPREIHFDLVDRPNGNPRRIYIAGLGKLESITAENFRQAGGAVAKAMAKHSVRSAAIILPRIKSTPSDTVAAAVTTGLMLASFDYREYKGAAADADDKSAKKTPVNYLIIGDEFADAVDRARKIAEAQNFARTIAFRPGNEINPPSLANVARSLAKNLNIGLRVLDEKEMKRLGMGGILAVGAGSSLTPPRMIVLEYKSKIRNPKSASKNPPPILVIGKAITFDTGGISIKPAEKMGQMVFDKCGGMAVLGLMCALARLKLPVHVVGILSSAENHISESAYRPGDILKMYNGVTVEVTNTDAEGRLVLADALAWGIETYKPAAVVDLATLTGGVIVALGTSMAGVMCNDDGLFAQLQAAADRCGEKIWRLPLAEEIRDQMKSNVADIVNSAGRQASPLQGSAFLSYFVPKNVPWAHFDIAGTADTEKDLPYYRKGATGWGVRTLVEWIEARSRPAKR